MLRTLLRLLSTTRQASTSRQTGNDQVILFAHVGAANQEKKKRYRQPQPLVPAATAPSWHRQRLLGMRLEHTQICSPQRCRRLEQLGVISAGDLSRANLERLAESFGAPRKALRILKQYRRAIRFAAAVPGMMPRDALLLISIHRRSVRGLALETAASLHRDLERFAESSQGRLQLRGRRIPSTRRIKRWIAACESSGRQSPVQARAA